MADEDYSETTISIMASEIVELREELARLSTGVGLGRRGGVEAVNQKRLGSNTHYQTLGPPSRPQEFAPNTQAHRPYYGDLTRRTSGQSTIPNSSSRISSVVSNSTAVNTSRAPSLALSSGNTLGSKFDDPRYLYEDDPEHERALLIATLRAAEAERDAALFKLDKLSRVLEEEGLDYRDLERGVLDTEEDDGYAYTRPTNKHKPNAVPDKTLRTTPSRIPTLRQDHSGIRSPPKYHEPSTVRLVPSGLPHHAQQRQQQTPPLVRPTLPRDPSTTLTPAALEDLRFDILSRLPVPPDYPEDPLAPIVMPAKMDLEGFLELSTGSTKKLLRDNRRFLAHEIIWCATRPYHAYIFEPRQVSRPSIAPPSIARSNPLQPPRLGTNSYNDESYSEHEAPQIRGNTRRWAENSASSVMRTRPVEVFYRQEQERLDEEGSVLGAGPGDWFYVGTFKSYALPDMTPEEFAGADDMMKDSLVRATMEKWPTTDRERTRELEKELKELYMEGTLKVACVGLQCMGFNHSLSRIMLEQSKRLKTARTNAPSPE